MGGWYTSIVQHIDQKVVILADQENNDWVKEIPRVIGEVIDASKEESEKPEASEIYKEFY